MEQFTLHVEGQFHGRVTAATHSRLQVPRRSSAQNLFEKQRLSPNCGIRWFCENKTIPNRFDRQPPASDSSGQTGRTPPQAEYATGRQRLYLTVSGIQWRMLPADFPPWQSVYTYFSKWRDDGTWRRLHDTLRVRVHSGDTSIQLLAASIVRRSRRASLLQECEVTMVASASQDGNGIFWSIRWDSC